MTLNPPIKPLGREDLDESQPWKELPQASSDQLAEQCFQEARDLLRLKLLEAVQAGQFEGSAAVDIFDSFCRHFNTVLNIARDSRFNSHVAITANSALTLCLASFAAGSRDIAGWAHHNRREGVKRAEHARSEWAKKSASGQISEQIAILASENTRDGEDISISRDRKRVAKRIKPALDLRVDALKDQGFKASKLTVEAIAKRLERQTAR